MPTLPAFVTVRTRLDELYKSRMEPVPWLRISAVDEDDEALMPKMVYATVLGVVSVMRSL